MTAGNVADITMAEELLAEVEDCRYVLADKGADSDKLRNVIRAKGAKPVIPGRKSRTRKVRFERSRKKMALSVVIVGVQRRPICRVGRAERCERLISRR